MGTWLSGNITENVNINGQILWSTHLGGAAGVTRLLPGASGAMYMIACIYHNC